MEVESQTIESKHETHGGVVRGLEELEVLFSDVKSRFLRYILFCVAVSLTWPILVAGVCLFGPFIYFLNGPDGRRRFLQCVLAGCGIIMLFVFYFGI